MRAGILGARSAVGYSGFHICRSPPPLFSARRVGATNISSADNIRPEPETRNGLSLARNDAFATITRSTFLACPFESTYKHCADPFRRRLSARFGFEAATGRIHHPQPVIHALLIRSHDATPSPLPFGRFCPPDQSVQRAASQEARLTGHPICISLPVALSFDCASDQCSKLRFALLGYRSAYRLRQRSSISGTLERHPFSGLIHSAGELLHTP